MRFFAAGLALSIGLAAQTGIAAQYPGDVGIASDPRVVLVEDFESGTIANLSSRWDQVMNGAGMSFVSGVPEGSPGSRALRMTSSSSDSGGHLYTRLPSAQTQLYLRYYVRYVSSGGYHHAGGYLGGYNPATSYPQGGSGEAPQGNERFSVGFEPLDDNLRFDFYSYWMGMGGLPDGSSWGNSFIQDSSLRVTPGEWTCVEVMVKLNSPVGSSNGELAAWVNGQQVAHLGPGFPNGSSLFGIFTPDPSGPPWPGFQWRNDAALAINWIWLNFFTSGTAAMEWDHVVAATDYIGPLSDGPPAGGGGSPPQRPILRQP
jgi:hypothetical protein